MMKNFTQRRLANPTFKISNLFNFTMSSLSSVFISTTYGSVEVADGKYRMIKLASDQIEMTPRNWRTFSSVLNEPFIAKFCDVISAPLTVKERAVTSCAALFSWCNL